MDMRDTINTILQLKLDSSDKINVILTVLSVKPLSMIGFDFNHFLSGNSFKEISEEEIKELIFKLNSIGLVTKISKFDEHPIRNPLIIISKEEKLIQKYLTNSENHLIVGKLLGFPETALTSDLDAVPFLNMLQKYYTKETVPLELLYITFIPKFVANKIDLDHIGWAKRNMEIISNYAPILHQQFVNERKNACFNVKYSN